MKYAGFHGHFCMITASIPGQGIEKYKGRWRTVGHITDYLRHHALEVCFMGEGEAGRI